MPVIQHRGWEWRCNGGGDGRETGSDQSGEEVCQVQEWGSIGSSSNSNSLSSSLAFSGPLELVPAKSLVQV